MSFDALSALNQAGHPLQYLSESQKSVLAELTPAEVETLNSIKSRLDAVGAGEVEGQHVFIIL